MRSFGEIMTLSGFLLAFQAYSAPSPSPVPAKRRPCADVMDACLKGGYKQGGAKEGKGLHAHCVGVLIKGQKVPGVDVGPGPVQKCKEFLDKMGVHQQ